MPPLIDNRYDVVRELGHGTFGQVLEVDDLHQGARLALKLLEQGNPAPAWVEAEVLTRLRSPYILEVRNADIDPSGTPYLVTEVALGGSTDHRMNPLPVSPHLAVRWIRAACNGAARTHDAGLVHRDIKPANIFLTSDASAKLGDFGIAHLMDQNGRAPAMGTPVTKAPEVARGEYSDAKSDIYSLGASLYALLTGRYPHEGTGPNGIDYEIVNDPPPPLRDLAPHVGRALAAKVMTALAKDPIQRFDSAAAFAASLGELPQPRREWERTDEHTGHTSCWRGSGTGLSDTTVCLVPMGPRAEVLGVHQPSGRRIGAACRPPAPPSQHARNVRAAIAAVG